MALIILCFFMLIKDDHYSFHNNREKIVMDDMLIQYTKRYFGYYSIKLPTDFVPTDGGMFIHGSDMTQVATKKQYLASFKQFIRRYEDKLRNTRVIEVNDEPYLKGKYMLPDQNEGVIFERMEDQYTPDFARILDAWKWSEEVTFEIKMKAQDGRSDKYDKVRSFYELEYNVKEKLKKIIDIFNAMKPRRDDKSPKQNNLAFQYAEVEPSVLGEYELSTRYSNSKNITITLNTNNNDYVDTLLLDTDSRIMEIDNGKTLHKGTRNVNGLHISEWWVKRRHLVPPEPYLKYEFNLKINESKDKKGQYLELTMRYDADVQKPDEILTEHEVVALWQHITITLQYHPPGKKQ